MAGARYPAESKLTFGRPELDPRINASQDMRSKLLYLSPKIPRAGGHGTAMRAGLHVRLLAELFDLHLVVVTEEPNADATAIPAEIRQCCAAVHVVQADGYRDFGQRLIWNTRSEQLKLIGRALHPYPLGLGMYTSRTIGAVIERLEEDDVDVIHAFHLHMAPMAIAIARSRRRSPPHLVLDLDDFESKVAERRAHINRRAMGLQWYLLHRLEARKYAFWERRLLKRFEQVWLSSEQDRRILEDQLRFPSAFCLPNGFDVPAHLPATGCGTPFTFLFVGTMSYSPNNDGVLFFCRSVLPILRNLAEADFRIVVVGRGPSDELMHEASRHPELSITGEVPEVTGFYRDAHAVIAPLRLGGGTKIKLLEAFGFGVPVVTTTAGAAGLQAVDGTHVLVADSPNAFALECVRLMKDRELRHRLARNAFELVSSRYGVGAIRSAIRERYLQLTCAP